jgi:hypothetical protein
MDGADAVRREGLVVAVRDSLGGRLGHGTVEADGEDGEAGGGQGEQQQQQEQGACQGCRCGVFLRHGALRV